MFIKEKCHHCIAGFHNLRALFFARNNDMNALGFDAQDVTKPESFYRNQARKSSPV
jgi:SanA protein